jgi:hypothetical protein
MRLANERMSDPLEGASDQMMMVALILLYFNVSTQFLLPEYSSNDGDRLDLVP